MSDTNNPGLVSVADEVLDNPDPNGGDRLLVPEQDDVLTAVGDQGYPPAANGVDASVFPTPAEVVVTGLPGNHGTQSVPVPPAVNVIVDDQVIGQGNWVYVDPLNPAAGRRFVSPADFIVTGPAESFQTNNTEATTVGFTVTSVLDANTYAAPTSATTRYMLVVNPPNPVLTAFPVTMLGRQVVFADDTLTAGDQGAARIITGFGANFVVVNQADDSVSNGDVPVLAQPQAGDTFTIDTQRQGSEQVNTTSSPTVDVIILPPPPTFVPNPAQSQGSLGTLNVSTGPQPVPPPVTSGTRVPTATNVFVADQATSVGLPVNVSV
jgi:hypothetical protein